MATKIRLKSDSDQPADNNDIDQTVAISRLVRVLAGEAPQGGGSVLP